MLHRVVKPFPCSWDGLTLVDLNVGDERDFGSMAAGLVAEGWIEAVEAVAVVPLPDTEPLFEAAIDTQPIEAAVVKHAPAEQPARRRRGR